MGKIRLILTVGLNPVPVWVAYKHLTSALDDISDIVLVHTSGTKEEAERLKTSLNGNSNISKCSISASIKSKSCIFLQDHLNGKPAVDKVHIHYTGGTKAMAVHCIEFFEDNGLPISCSYLDARGTIEPKIVDYEEKYIIADCRKGITANFEQMLKIQGIDLKSVFINRKKIELPPPLSEENFLQWKQFLNNFTTKERVKLSDCVTIKNELKTIAGRSNYEVFPYMVGARKQGEELILDTLILLGYQVIILSYCNSGHESNLKLEAMESCLKARQVGGSEARVIMLCDLSKERAQAVEDDLYDEMGMVWDDEDEMGIGENRKECRQIRIWGPWGQDLKNVLSTMFQEYLKNELAWC